MGQTFQSNSLLRKSDQTTLHLYTDQRRATRRRQPFPLWSIEVGKPAHVEVMCCFEKVVKLDNVLVAGGNLLEDLDLIPHLLRSAPNFRYSAY